jgi:GAF domain-containing protein
VCGETGTRLLGACVELADTLGEEPGSAGILPLLADRCVELVGVEAAGLLVADDDGGLRVAAATCESAHLLTVAERDDEDGGGGPARDCHRTGTPVTAPDLARDGARWPAYAIRALHSGYTAAFALPLRRQEEVIGAVTLFRTTPGPLPADRTALAQTLADAATVGVLQRRARQRNELLAAQLQFALDSRIVVEQAKGVLAERWGIGVDEAFTVLRAHARTGRVRLAEVARGVLDGTVEPVRGPVR